MNTLHQSPSPTANDAHPGPGLGSGSQDATPSFPRYFKRQSLQSVGAALGSTRMPRIGARSNPATIGNISPTCGPLAARNKPSGDLVTF